MDIKRVGKYALYLIPGYGSYQEFKKPKEKRSLIGTIGFTLYAAGFFLKLSVLPAYVTKGITTGEWNPFKIKSEKIKEIPTTKKSKLEEKANVFYDSLYQKRNLKK